MRTGRIGTHTCVTRLRGVGGWDHRAGDMSQPDVCRRTGINGLRPKPAIGLCSRRKSEMTGVGSSGSNPLSDRGRFGVTTCVGFVNRRHGTTANHLSATAFERYTFARLTRRQKVHLRR